MLEAWWTPARASGRTSGRGRRPRATRSLLIRHTVARLHVARLTLSGLAVWLGQRLGPGAATGGTSRVAVGVTTVYASTATPSNNTSDTTAAGDIRCFKEVIGTSSHS